jgi:hypothetical protein
LVSTNRCVLNEMIIWSTFYDENFNVEQRKAATTLLSASMDKSMVLWTFDDNQKMFIDKVNKANRLISRL